MNLRTNMSSKSVNAIQFDNTWPCEVRLELSYGHHGAARHGLV
jgi:hypothetical protein